MSSTPTGIVIAGLLLTAGCARSSAHEYELQGQVLAINPARQEVTIKHEDIPRFMPGMTMTFRVKDENLLQGRIAGDLVKATLVVRENEVHIRMLERTGFWPLSGPAEIVTVPLGPGEQVVDATFIDESGATRRLADWRGRVLAVTFMYTRCPFPNFCPLMDRYFRTVQENIRNDTELVERIRLLSVSLDPGHDTPLALSQHAAKLRADPAIWRFLTGDADELARFAKQFGVAIAREAEGDQEIVHNLRTAVVGPDGRLITLLNGSEWTPSHLVAELKKGALAGTAVSR